MVSKSLARRALGVRGHPPLPRAGVVIPSPRPVVALAVAVVSCQGWRSHRLRPEVLDGAAPARLTSGRSGRWGRRPGDLPASRNRGPGARGGAPIRPPILGSAITRSPHALAGAVSYVGISVDGAFRQATSWRMRQA